MVELLFGVLPVEDRPVVGAEQFYPRYNKHSHVTRACAFKLCMAVVKLLLDHATDIKAANNDGRTALHNAAWNGHEPVVKLLIAQGADMNAADKYGATALHGAARKGHEPVVKLLIERGIDVNATNKDGITALHGAALEGYEQLHQAGADVRARSKSGSTPLHQAVLGGHFEIVQWLLGLDVEASVIDDEEWTPLHDVASKGYLDIAKELYQARADVRDTVFTMWEISLRAIETMSGDTTQDAVELLPLWPESHRDNILALKSHGSLHLPA